MTAADKLEALKELLSRMGGALVAFSGGVDSTFLLRVAHDVLGKRAVAVTALSESFPAREQAEAKRLARQIGTRHIFVETRELDREQYRRNTPQRCYFCKSELFEKLLPLAEREGLEAVVYGEIADDAGDHRPGIRAARERRIRAPLAEVGLTKAEIRELSREIGLPTWDKPSMACLSSRIPYGRDVTPAKLTMVERAEEVLRALGLRQVRVRHHDAVARIETDAAGFERLRPAEVRERVAAKLREIGFTYVALDLQGYRTGRLNEAVVLRASGAGGHGGGGDHAEGRPRRHGGTEKNC
ncbi:MAG: ATP-dependent sacrificial sulfur transferase LarE [Planctomycetes bacterium]|nr:ATP-dependent sacrificial sulfur transferase LarE [Planctomycetota bacterium]